MRTLCACVRLWALPAVSVVPTAARTWVVRVDLQASRTATYLLGLVAMRTRVMRMCVDLQASHMAAYLSRAVALHM